MNQRIKMTHTPLFKDRTRCGAQVWPTRSTVVMAKDGEEPTCSRCLAILAGERRRAAQRTDGKESTNG